MIRLPIHRSGAGNHATKHRAICKLSISTTRKFGKSEYFMAADQKARSTGWEFFTDDYFAFVKHPFATSAEAAAEHLAATAGLLTLPGSFFGPGQEDHLRIAVANVDETQIEAVGRRLRALDR